jgi:Mg-chelatase subunit ChlD
MKTYQFTFPDSFFISFLLICSLFISPILFAQEDGQLILEVDESHEFTFSEDESEAFFSINLDGMHFHYMEIMVPEGTLMIEASMRSSRNNVEQRVSYSTELSTNHGKKHERYNLPQDGGLYEFKLWWIIPSDENLSRTTKVQFVIKKGKDLVTPRPGGLGVIRAQGIPSGDVSATSEGQNAYNNISEGIGDRLPDGDVVMWLPAGMWKVRASTAADSDAPCSFTDCHFVPVVEGRETILKWPGAMMAASSGRDLGRLEILDEKTKGSGEAWVDVSLLGGESAVNLDTGAVDVFEGGLEGSVQSVEPLTSPLSVVLLLDSSGSMKASMDQAIEATKQFVKALPRDCNLTIVDFDTTPKFLNGKTKEELVQSLNQVRANGATALFDSIILGLEHLKSGSENNRPVLVVFTDGVDANWNDTAPGSKATKDEVIEAVKTANIPVFSIGFGKSPDRDTLGRISRLSSASYFEATDSKSLQKVFNSIATDLTRQFRIHYKRPKASKSGDVPVVALMIDNSGSMDHSPESEGCGYRIEAVRQLFRRFVDALPKEVIVQVMTFSEDARINQVFTTDKTKSRKAIAEMEGRGGTNIIAALKTSSKVLSAIPSKRRYLCFLSDAALDVDDGDKDEFDKLLGGLKDDGIQSLWIGMVPDKEAAPFKRAATMSAGKAIVAEDIVAIDKVVHELLLKVSAPAETSKGTTLRVSVRQGTKGLSAAKNVNFAPLIDEGRKETAEEVRHEIGKEIRPYGGEVANLISGSCIPSKDVVISSRLTINQTRSNSAAELTVNEAFFIDRLRGIMPPNGKRLIAITTLWHNKLPLQEVAVFKNGANHPSAWISGAAEPDRYELSIPTYLIPDLRRHCFLRWNKEKLLPISDATWLAEEPMVLPGERSLGVVGGKDIRGTIIFLVPFEQMNQASLELFDTDYGHIQVPVAGEPMEASFKELTTLPTSAPAKMSDAFSLTLNGFRDEEAIEGTKAGDGMVFRVIDASFTSRVQALLDFDPFERFRLILQTHLGELVVPLHPITASLPDGLFESTLLAPGNRNKVVMAFRIPKVVSKGALFHGDISGGGMTISMDDCPVKPLALPKANIKDKGIELFIHKTGQVERITDLGEDFIAVEFSLKDEKDGEHTVCTNLMALKPKPKLKKALPDQGRMSKGMGNFGSNSSFRIGEIPPSDSTDKLLFGMSGDTIYFDGRTRRGLILFDIPSDFSAEDFILFSPVLEGLSVPISAEDYSNEVLFKLKQRDLVYPPKDEQFSAAISMAAASLIDKRRRERRDKVGAVPADVMTLESPSPEKQQLAPPSMTLFGKERLEALENVVRTNTSPSEFDLSPLSKVLKELRLVTSAERSTWNCRYSPEAVLTQGWAGVDDMARLARQVLTRWGYQTATGTVGICDEGRELLKKMARTDEWNGDRLPVIIIKDGSETVRQIVVPFLMDVSKIGNLVETEVEPFDDNQTSCKSSLLIEVTAKRRESGFTGNASVAADALSGDDESSTEQTFTILSATMNQDELSEGLCHITYTETYSMGKKLLYAFAGGSGGTFVSEEPIDMSQWKIIREDISIQGDQMKPYKKKSDVGEKDSIVNRFHSFVLAAPDLPSAAIEKVQEQWKTLHKEAPWPNSLSALQWYSAGVIYRFIAAQTAIEEKACKKFRVTNNRADMPRLIMVTSSREFANGPLKSSMDLAFVKSLVQGGDEEHQQYYRLMTGMLEGQLEQWALPGGMGLSEIWKRCPEGTTLLPLFEESKTEALEQMRTLGYPERVIEGIESSEDIILMTSKPANIKGHPRWAWISINPYTMETTTILDDLSHGSMAEDAIMSMMSNLNQCIVGCLKGIETSLWAVTSFSLITENEKEIYEGAYEFCMGLAGNFGAGVSGKYKGTDWGVGCGIGSLPSADFGLGGITFKDGGKLTANQNIVTFGSGFKAGVEMYFGK